MKAAADIGRVEQPLRLAEKQAHAAVWGLQDLDVPGVDGKPSGRIADDGDGGGSGQ